MKLNKNANKENLIEVCLAIVNEHFKVSREELASKSRKDSLVLLRIAITAVLNNEVDIKRREVAKIFQRDHASITHYVKMHNKIDSEGQRKYRRIFETLEELFKERIKTTTWMSERILTLNRIIANAEREKQQLRTLLKKSKEMQTADLLN